MKRPSAPRAVALRVIALLVEKLDGTAPRGGAAARVFDALLAGQPAQISVTALRREEAPQQAPDANKPILDAAETVQTEAVRSPPSNPISPKMSPGCNRARVSRRSLRPLEWI